MSALDVTPAAIAERLRTQNNHCTREPLYVVQQRRRITGLDPRFSGEIAWWNSEETRVADADEHARLESEFADTGDEPEYWTRSAFMDTWEFVTCCLTEAGAQAYIKANGHNLTDPRVYVDSAWRNEEMIAARSALKAVRP